MRQSLCALILAALTAAASNAQDPFPTPIPTSEISVRAETFATIPDSAPGQPARASLITRDPTGRIFVNDQRGPLYTVSDSGAVVTEYLDLRDFDQPGSDLAILSTFEAGFQSFAFHPDFANEGTSGFGRFYTIHSSSNTAAAPDFEPADPSAATDFHTQLLEWRTNTPGNPVFSPANPSQPFRELMRLDQPFGNHNTGLIAFNPTVGDGDPDRGNLYIAVGDGGSAGDPLESAQDTSDAFGAILRINPLGDDSANGQYGIVSENALAADGDANTLGEIYAFGLRNPQRFGWDAQTGAMYIADIGQNLVEEINLGANGANFGWDDREGSLPFESNNTAGLTNPVAEYDHLDTVSDLPTNIANRAVTTGEVARGTGIPGLDGQLLLGDFPTGLIFTLDVDTDPLDGGQDGLSEMRLANDDLQSVRLLDLINEVRGDRGLGPATRADLRFGFNTPGEVFITNKQDGVIRRLAAVPEPSTIAILGLAGLITTAVRTRSIAIS